MAIGGFLGGLANLGAVTRGYEAQQAQEQQLQLAALRQKITQDALAEEQRQRQLQQQSASAAFGLLNDPNSPLAGLASIGGGQQPNYAPGAVQRQALPPPLPQVPSYGQNPMGTAGLQQLQQRVLGLEGNRDVIGKAGEIGPGQILPSTGRQYGYQPSQLMGDSGRAASAAIVSDLYNRSGGDPAAALVGYNRGPGAMQRFQAAGDNPAAVPNLAPAYRAAIEQLSGPQQQQAQDAAISTATAVPPAYTGRLNLPQLAQLIKRNNPGISDEAGMGALLMLNNLWSPQAKQQFEEYKFGEEQKEKGREFDIRERELGEQRKFDRWFKEETLGKGGSVYTDQAGNVYRIPPTGPATKVEGIAPGTTLTRPGGPTSAPLPELKYPDKWEGMPNTPPPGVTESAWDIALNFARTGQMPTLGFASDLRRPVIQAYPAALHALGIEPSKASDIAAAYAGERHAEIVGGGRAAQISLGLKEAEQLGPTVIEAAKGIPATNLPIYNQFINWLNTQSGDPNIVKFRAALNSFLQTYTRTVGGSMQLTDFRLRHAYELINDAMAHGQINSAISQLTYEMQVMGSAVPGAMQDLQQIGQPPATRQQQQTPTPAGSTQQYRTPGDVETAVKNGQLSREDGIAILQNQFGAK